MCCLLYPQKPMNVSSTAGRGNITMPFAGGPRICVGASFAITQMLIVVAALARRFRFPLVAGHPVRPVGHISLHPYGGLKVTVERRVAARP